MTAFVMAAPVTVTRSGGLGLGFAGILCIQARPRRQGGVRCLNSPSRRAACRNSISPRSAARTSCGPCPRCRMPEVDLPKVDLPDIGKAVAGAAAAANIGRRSRPRWPFAVGGLILAGMATAAILSNETIRAKIAAGFEALRERVSTMRSTDDDRLDFDRDEAVAFDAAPTAPDRRHVAVQRGRDARRDRRATRPASGRTDTKTASRPSRSPRPAAADPRPGWSHRGLTGSPYSGDATDRHRPRLP